MRIGLDGFDLWGGGAGASSELFVPLGMGTEKFAWAEEFCGELGDPAPLRGSRSISMALLPLMADCARVERRLRSSGGKFSGWVSGSNLDRREDDEEPPRSVEWREAREGREDLGDEEDDVSM